MAVGTTEQSLATLFTGALAQHKTPTGPESCAVTNGTPARLQQTQKLSTHDGRTHTLTHTLRHYCALFF